MAIMIGMVMVMVMAVMIGMKIVMVIVMVMMTGMVIVTVPVMRMVMVMAMVMVRNTLSSLRIVDGVAILLKLGLCLLNHGVDAVTQLRQTLTNVVDENLQSQVPS